MVQIEEFRSLAKYYRDILNAMSQQTGKHFIDLGSVLKYGLTADLGLFVDGIDTLLYSDKLVLSINRMSPKTVTDIINKSDIMESMEESGESGQSEDEELEDSEKKTTSARLIAIYRKQEQDRYNRETTVGFPIIAGRHGSIKICGPLFFYTVNVDYDPLKSKITLTKNFVNPVLNTQLISKLVTEDGELDIIRDKVFPLIYGEDDFSEEVINNTITIIGETIKSLRGLKWDPRKNCDLKSTYEARDNEDLAVFRAFSIVNSNRGNAFLLDELQKLAGIEEIDGDTVINTILSEVPENVDEETDDPDSPSHERPLLFPLQSNIAQRRAARKAEKARLMVIQGPPGTGKSQTIANLVCDLVAQDHSVLIASHQNKALQVVSEKLPDIDYLALSLLKGEKASTIQLADKLATFDTYVADVTTKGLSKSLERIMTNIKEKESEIHSLQARFSELKTLERDRFPHYHKFHTIRNYNCISQNDFIPLGKENEVAKALKEWVSLFKFAKEHFADLRSIFGKNQKEITSTQAKHVVGTILKIIDCYKQAKELSIIGIAPISKEIVQKATFDNEYCLKFLDNVGIWLDENGYGYLSSRKKLMEFEIALFPFKEGLRKCSGLGGDILNILSEKAVALNSYVVELAREGVPLSLLPEVPKLADIKVIVEAVKALENASFPSWFVNPACISARSQLAKFGLGKCSYGTRSGFLGDIKKWSNHWSMKKSVVSEINSLIEYEFPLKKNSSTTPLPQITEQVNIAVSYLEYLKYLNDYPQSSAPQKYVDGIIEIMESVEDLSSLRHVRNIIEKSGTFLQCILEYNSLAKSLSKNLIDHYSFIRGCIFNLEFTSDSDSVISKLETLLALNPEFEKLVTLEEETLKVIPETIVMLKQSLLDNQEPAWLEDIDKAIEAYRLSEFIRKDKEADPDDINFIAERIKKAKEEKANLVVNAIRTRRKLSLRQASQDPVTKQQIIKLHKILSRKKKTVSLVQLKNQIDYNRFLSVFPCWIMSIDDVARIFPLKAGLFDYLIVDEASQCNQATALHLAYRAKKMIVVGDQKQMKNPNIRFLSDKIVRILLAKYGLDIHPKAEFLHGRESLLALSYYSANCSVFLNEHFRCEPPIIAWSNEKFYDNKLKILTAIRRKRFMPCLEVHLVRGADDDVEAKKNHVEANAVISEVIRLISTGDADGLTIGIMTMYREQATLLQSLLYEKLLEDKNSEWIKKYQIIASTADGFQGDERDIILYSMRYGPSSSPGTINAIQIEEERLNVAFTRARRKMICFISRPVEEFPRGLIRDFLMHAENEQRNPIDRLGMVGEDKFDSVFEKDVCQDLRKRGYTVYTQVPCSSFFIDMVVIDSEGRRIAVECDGDFHYEEDGELRAEDGQRQDIIERSGWFVHRMPVRRYYENPKAAITLLIDDLLRQPTDRQITASESEVGNLDDVFPDLDSGEMVVKDIGMAYEPEVETEQADPESIQLPLIFKDQEEIQSYLDKKSSKKKKVQRKKAIKPRDSEELDTGGIIWDNNVWFALSHWGKVSGKQSSYYNSFCYSIGKSLSKNYKLSEKQKMYAEKVWNSALAQGFDPCCIEK